MTTLDDTESLLAALPSARVAVIGDHGLDAYWELAGETGEVSWETGFATRRVLREIYSPAGASNVAVNLAALGVRDVRAIGVRGNDVFGRELDRALTAAGVDTSALRAEPTLATLVYAKPVLAGAEQTRFDFGTDRTVPAPLWTRLMDDVRAALAEGFWMIANEQVLGGLLHAARAAAFRETIAGFEERVVVDTRHEAAAFGSVIFKLNRREAAAFLNGESARTSNRTAVADPDGDAIARAIFDRTGRTVYLTLAAEGVLIADASGVTRVPGVRLDGPVDPVGCGDTFIAALTTALAAGASPIGATRLANRAAAVTCRKLGVTGCATPSEILGLRGAG